MCIIFIAYICGKSPYLYYVVILPSTENWAEVFHNSGVYGSYSYFQKFLLYICRYSFLRYLKNVHKNETFLIITLSFYVS